MPLTSAPTVIVEVGFASNAFTPLASVSWTDISTYVLNFKTHAGRQHELSRVEAGTADLVLDNRDRRFDPTNTSSPYSPNVVPMKRLRIRATWNAITYNVFNGFVESWSNDWLTVADSNVSVHCVDGFKALNLRNLLNPYLQAITNDSPNVHYLTSGTPGTSNATGTSQGAGGTPRSPGDGPPLQALSAVFTAGPGAFAGKPTLNQIDPIQDGVDGGVLFNGSTADELVSPLGTGLQGTGDFSLECWFLNPGPTNAHLIRQLPLFGGLQLTVSGVIAFETFTLGGTDYIITSPAATYSDNQWHHVVATRVGAALKLYVDGALVQSGTVAGTVSLSGTPLHFGPGPDNPIESFSMYEIAVYPVALSATQVTAHYNAAKAWANDYSGARVNRILDAISWASADRTVETGLSQLQAEPQPGNSLQSLTDCATAENGLLFCDPSGKVVFYDRSHLVLTAASNTSQATFGDGGGSELPYVLAGIKPVMDDLDLWNDVQVTRAGGVLQEVQDVSSETTYGTRSLTLTGLKLAADNDSLSRSQHDLAVYKDPRTRVRSFTVTALSDPTNLFPQLLGRSLWDRVTFKRRPPGGGAAFSQDSIIEGISHSYTKADWQTTYALSPADTTSYFALDTSTLNGADSLFY